MQVEGNQVSNSVTEFYEYTPDGRILYTENSSTKKNTNYIWANQTLWCEINEGVVYYHHTDHLGTTEVVTDTSGKMVWSADYEAFGSVLSERGDSLFTPSYTGKFFDKSSGLYYFNARWYDSELGRFTTYDLLKDGINWKNYCNGNPLVRIDKTGNYWEYIEEGNAIVQVWIEESAATGLTKAGVSSVTKLRGLGLIAAFCLSLQGSQIHPALPPNFTWENNNIIAPDGTIMPSADAAWNYSEGNPEWFKTNVLYHGVAGKLAKKYTQNSDSKSLVLGKNTPDGSYVDVAQDRGATYFSMPPKTWNALESKYNKQEMWKINENFLKQQIKQKKEIYLSHDPNEWIDTDTFFGMELRFLKRKGYTFIKDGNIWKAEKIKK